MCIESRKKNSRWNMLAAITCLMDNVNCLQRVSPPSLQLKQSYPRSGWLTGWQTYRLLSVCVIHSLFTPLADWHTHPSHLKHQRLLIWRLSCLMDRWDILPCDPVAFFSPVTIRVSVWLLRGNTERLLNGSSLCQIHMNKFPKYNHFKFLLEKLLQFGC